MTEVLEKKGVTNCKDVIFTGISVMEGVNPSVNFMIFDCISKKVVEISIPRVSMTPKEVQKQIVSRNGICDDDIAKEICDNLINSYNQELRKQDLCVKRYHSFLGWQIMDGIAACLLYKAISNGSIDSTYNGKVDIKPVGDINEFVRVIKEEITSLEEWCKLEAIISFSVGSIILSYANRVWKESINTFIIHLFGGSTSGKSTALKLFLSLASNPEKKKGFWMSYASTAGSLIKRMGNLFGIPVVIDEISSGTKKEMDDFVYTVGNGEEKDRLTAGGTKLQDSATFEMVVLSNGEVSLLKKCSKNEGIRVRCIELANQNWTISKEQSETLQRCVSENYGLVIPLIAEELIKNDARWRDRWEYLKKKVREKIDSDGIKCSIRYRIADYVALFTLAAEITNAVLDLELHIDKIFKFCYEHIIIANDEEANMSVRAYDAIVEYISSHKNDFADAGFFGGARTQFNDVELGTDKVGFFHNIRRKIVNGKECDNVYVFRRGLLESILSEAGFSETKVTLHKLRQDGYLKTKDKKRDTYPYKINGSVQQCIAVYFRDETMDANNSFDDEY